MARQGSWRGELLGGFAVVASCTLLGSLIQQAVLGFALANVGILLYWGWHLRMVQRWLDRPLEDPPTGRGVWGHLLDSIFRLQRQNREAQSRLESALDYLQDSLASMRDGGIIVNNRGGIAWANASADYLLGIRFPEDRGQSLLNLVRMPEFQSYYESEDFTNPLRVTNVSEDERSLQFEITRFGAGDRLVFVRDITDTVRLEQMRRDFVGDVSHELRTPLTVLKGYIDTLKDLEVFSARQYSKPLEQMQQQAARMENLLRDLLWLSKIETFESHRKTERVYVGSVLSEMVGELRAAYPERTIALQIEGDTTIIGDEPELRSAFSNLVVNALKYSDKEVAVCWQGGADVSEFLVVDQGSGIAAKHIPRLTERFYRVDKSRSQNSGGTGLGLAIVKHVAAAHQAELVIESELGRGSRFGIRFYSSRKIRL